MKYILSEQQNDRIMKIIKSVANTYTNEYVVKTDVEVESTNDYAGDTYYVLYPKFYIEKDMWRNLSTRRKNLFRHELADFVETMVGVPVHSSPMRIELI